MIKDIEINPQFEKALHLIDETGKNIVVLASTGVAADANLIMV